MFNDPDEMLENCPKEIEEDLKEIIELSESFLNEVDIQPNQYLSEIKIDLQEAKNYLFKIINRFVALVNENYEEDIKDNYSRGLKFKFDDDIGAIIGDLKKKPTDRLESSIGITTLLKFSGELKTAYDFLIYTPIIRTNKRKFETTKKYFEDIFVIVRANASMLGYAEKAVIPLSKKMLPKPTDMISINPKQNKQEETGDLKGLGGLGKEEDEEEEEDEEDEND